MKNKIGPIVIVLIIIIAVVGSTYSWFYWKTSDDERIGVDFSTSGGSEECITYFTSASGDPTLIPASSKERGYIVTVELAQTCNTDLYIDLDLNLTSFPISLKQESFKYALVEDNNVISEGNFVSASQGAVIKLAENELLTSTKRTFKLYIWIDGNIDNPKDMQNQDYHFDLVAKLTDEMPS